MDRSAYQRMAEQEDRHWWFHARRQILARLIARFLPASADPQLLEVGCGSGGNLALLGRFGRVDAAEYDEEARAMAARKSGRPIGRCALPDRLDATDDRYDLVALFDVLEHVEDDVGSLRAVSRKLAPGGRILITVPALPWLWSAHDDLHHHFRRYTKNSLSRAAGLAGLQVLKGGYFCTILFPLVVAARAAKRTLGIRTADDEIPNPLVNSALRRVFALERFVIGRIPLPIGSSLFMVLERPQP